MEDIYLWVSLLVICNAAPKDAQVLDFELPLVVLVMFCGDCLWCGQIVAYLQPASYIIKVTQGRLVWYGNPQQNVWASKELLLKVL